MGELQVVRRERVLVAEKDGGDGAGGVVGRIYGVLLLEEREQGTTIAGKLVAIFFLPRAVRRVVNAFRQPFDQIGETRDHEGARREGYSAESEKAIDVRYTDENAG